MKILSTQEFVGGAKITGLPQGVNAGEPITVEQFNSAIEGIAWKDSVRVATQANINLAAPGATVDGVAMVSLDRVLVRAQTLPEANGLYVWNGSAVAMTRTLDASTSSELEAATVTVEEGTSTGSTFRQTSVNFVLDTGGVVFIGFGTAAPAATETIQGIAELATQGETDAGADDFRIVTPLKLASYANRKKEYNATFGDGSATQFTITHNLSTLNPQVTVRRNSGLYDEVGCDIAAPTANTVQLNFVLAPTVSQFKIAILG